MRRLPTKRPPTHPGEMLLKEFLEPLGISQTEFARRIGVSWPRLNELINQRRGVTPDTALRLARVLRMRRTSGWDYRWTGISGTPSTRQRPRRSNGLSR